jgi:hypothetical protein
MRISDESVAELAGAPIPLLGQYTGAYMIKAGVASGGMGSGSPLRCAAVDGRIRVFTITITAPQHGHTIGARGLNQVATDGGTTFNSTCTSAISRLQFGCRKPKFRARRNPFGNTCCNTSQRKAHPGSVRRAIFPVFASR